MTKKIFTFAILAMISYCATFAMSASRAREEANYLTDKMAYRLGLTSYQWDDVYQINYDFFWEIDDLGRNYAHELNLRNQQLSYVLTREQWRVYNMYDYFVTPAYVRNAVWVFPIYNYYKRSHYYYGGTHRIMNTYRGGYKGNLSYYTHRHPTAHAHHGTSHYKTTNSHYGTTPNNYKYGSGHNNRTGNYGTTNNRPATGGNNYGTSNNRPSTGGNNYGTSNNRPSTNNNYKPGTSGNNNRGGSVGGSRPTNTVSTKTNNNSSRTGGGGFKRK